MRHSWNNKNVYLTKNKKNKMKSKLTIMAATVAVLVGISTTVQATPINGSIGFSGLYKQNGGTVGDLTTANSFTIASTLILSATGDFTGATLGSFASPITVNPASGLSTLWSVIVGSTTYTFNVTSESESLDSASQINLLGAGTITDGNPADTTAGTWQLGFGVSGDSFIWQSTSSANVPDGGTTAMLLGAGMAGLFLFRKKVMA
jgi:hypothetical protein